MHTHDDNPCWDAHCAPHHTHHDAATRELIAAAEARGAEREWARILEAVVALPDNAYDYDEVGERWVRSSTLRALLAEHRDEATQ